MQWSNLPEDVRLRHVKAAGYFSDPTGLVGLNAGDRIVWYRPDTWEPTGSTLEPDDSDTFEKFEE